MCYFNGIKVTRAELIRLTGISTVVRGMEPSEPIDTIYHDGFTFSEYPILRPSSDCEVELSMATWGFIPHFTKTRVEWEAIRYPRPNLDARGENLISSNQWRDSAKNRRCLIPSSGFYEWRWHKKEGRKTIGRYPHYINIPEKDYFLIAGIWRQWADEKTGEVLETFAMVTTKANKLMAQVHNKSEFEDKGEEPRMPTILTDELAAEWISDGLNDERITEIATYQCPVEGLHVMALHKDFKKLENRLTPFEYPELPALVA